MTAQARSTLNPYRTHLIKNLDNSLIDREISIAGWVQTIRDHGDLFFLELRDYDFILQCCIDKKTNQDLLQKAQKLTAESVVSLTGILRQRPLGSEKKDRIQGHVELLINKIDILSFREESTHSLPFPVNSSAEESKESLRHRYRFLDLRSFHNQFMLQARHRLMKLVRQGFDDHGFTEIHTPILGPVSPEGARSYIVPSYNHLGSAYALAQAPQLWKQMLMASGVNRYYQIAPCFRAENARADRFPGEFYQIDMEMAFVTQEEVFSMVENIFGPILANWDPENRPLTTPCPWQRIVYKESMERFCSDKPDLRNPLEIHDFTSILAHKGPQAIRDLINNEGYQALGLWAPFIQNKPRSFFTEITQWIQKEHKVLGLAYSFQDETGAWKGPLGKFFEGDDQDLLKTRPDYKIKAGLGFSSLLQRQQELFNEKSGVFFVCAPKKEMRKIMNALRAYLAEKLQLINHALLEVCWIVDFPLYEENDEGGIDFSHNPFSMPQGPIGLESFSERDPLTIVAYQYDLVCNGIELCSGAIRNHKPALMYEIFSKVGYSKERVDSNFGAMIQAFSYGCPPHGGCAPGFDRLLMILLGKNYIRDCTAFYLNQDGVDPMMKSPMPLTDLELRDMGLKLVPKK